MELLEEDEAYLKSKGLSYNFVADGENGCLIFPGFSLAEGKYDRDQVDLMIFMTKGYNDAKLDNFYVEPAVRLKATNQYPEAAAHFENHAGRSWQRFSRHLNHWRAGVDTLQNFLPLVCRELQERG